MYTAAKDGVDGAVTMTADRCIEFQIGLSDAETEATTWGIADMAHIVSQLEGENYGIISTEQMLFNNGFSIRLIEYEAWWQVIGIQELRKPLNSV